MLSNLTASENGALAGAATGACLATAALAGALLLNEPDPIRTTGECEFQKGLVIVLPSADTPEAVCLKNGRYWNVQVNAFASWRVLR